MSIKIQCTTEKLIDITIKLDYSKVPSQSTVPTYDNVYGHKRNIVPSYSFTVVFLKNHSK